VLAHINFVFYTISQRFYLLYQLSDGNLFTHCVNDILTRNRDGTANGRSSR